MADAEASLHSANRPVLGKHWRPNGMGALGASRVQAKSIKQHSDKNNSSKNTRTQQSETRTMGKDSVVVSV